MPTLSTVIYDFVLDFIVDMKGTKFFTWALTPAPEDIATRII